MFLSNRDTLGAEQDNVKQIVKLMKLQLQFAKGI